MEDNQTSVWKHRADASFALSVGTTTAPMHLCCWLPWQWETRHFFCLKETWGRFPSPFPLLSIERAALFHLRPRRTVCACASTDSKFWGNPPSCSITCCRTTPAAFPVPAHPLLLKRDGPGSRWKRVRFPQSRNWRRASAPLKQLKAAPFSWPPRSLEYLSSQFLRDSFPKACRLLQTPCLELV